jgi:DNA-directed RNA polymerase subunit N (RpoN/RPB10)
MSLLEEKTTDLSDNSQRQHFEYNNFELLPIRCFTCQKIIGDKDELYKSKLKEGKSIEQTLNEMGVMRPCCRINIQNPPKIPLALQIDNQSEEIVRLYNSFNIDDKMSKALTSNTVNVDIINTTGNPLYNSKPLTEFNRPKRIYQLSGRTDNKQKFFDTEEFKEIEPNAEIFNNLETELIEEEENEEEHEEDY